MRSEQCASEAAVERLMLLRIFEPEWRRFFWAKGCCSSISFRASKARRRRVSKLGQRSTTRVSSLPTGRDAQPCQTNALSGSRVGKMGLQAEDQLVQFTATVGLAARAPLPQSGGCAVPARAHPIGSITIHHPSHPHHYLPTRPRFCLVPLQLIPIQTHSHPCRSSRADAPPHTPASQCLSNV